MEDLPIQGPVFLIEADKISPNPQQPRRDFNEEELKELAASIREFGILQPIIVTKVEKESELGTDVSYELIAGERRWRASKMAGLERIPAIIKNVHLDRDRLELAIIENVQRSDLNPIESARAYAKLQDEFKLTQREIAARLGKSRESIANTMRLLSLPTHVQEALASGRMSESQGRLLLTVEDIAQQQILFDDLLRSNISVRELKTRIEKHKQQKKLAGQIAETPAPEMTLAAANPEFEQLKNELETALGAKVKLEQDGQTGKLTITFYSPEELRGIVQKLLPSDQTSL